LASAAQWAGAMNRSRYDWHRMSDKSAKIAALIRNCQGRDLDAHYLAFFECFNRRLFYEAHEVLEKLWLPNRQGPNHLFYKGLIQLAGAFVHLQKGRPGPAASLLKLARANLLKFPAVHERLDVADVLHRAEAWLQQIESDGCDSIPLTPSKAPQIHLLSPG
jgi:predicted metal-dependent hydrolase